MSFISNTFFVDLNSPIKILFKVEFLNFEVSKIVEVPVKRSPVVENRHYLFVITMTSL